uniref:NADH-ubiquinone oxidoreductase chain 4L n=1 Tax=Acanthemblemaria sp. AC-2023 TaxID=3028466 RepID=A0AA51X3G6_9TELE|nr:NADH dehydrogenase subunit 4L [Acanthemblemaria sp. AC-2023]
MTPTHYVISCAFMVSLAGMAFNRKHLLSALLCLEAMMLSLYMALSLWTLGLDSPVMAMTPMILLTFAACEASVGLALLAATSRTHGYDRLRNLSLLQC